MSIHDNIYKTQQAFLNGVWPAVAETLGGGKIIPVEATGDRDFLDQYAGIDHWHILNGKHKVIRGIASRCQWRYKHVFKTFTVRIGRRAVEQTELAKRLYALDNKDKGIVCPHLFIQAWFDAPKGSYENFLCAGIAKMDDILTVIRDGEEGIDWKRQTTKAEYGNVDFNDFAVVDFVTLKNRGYNFKYVEGSI
jgi:hypothetical protein